MRRVLGITFLLLALSPAEAIAGWKLDRAQRIAEIVWNNPCPATIAWGEPTRAFASLPAFRMARAWAYKDQCRIEFSADWERRFGFSWQEVCSTMIHEYGHLAGYRHPVGIDGDHDHSPDPRSVMSPDREWGDRRCRKRGRPYLERHGILRPTNRPKRRSRADACASRSKDC